MSSLTVEGVTKRFGGLVALQEVDLTLSPGEILGLIGPNGAGKSTLLNVIAGVLKPTRGRVRLDGTDLTGRPPHYVASRGIIRTFQTVNLFQRLTVLENVLLGSYLKYGGGYLRWLLPLPSNRRRAREVEEEAYELLREVHLEQLARVEAQSLSLGHQRLLALAVALAARPRMLLLDEPLAGLSSQEQGEIMERVTALAGRGLGVLLVEHNIRAVMATCQRIVVLHYGVKIAEGLPREIAENPTVREVYLGTRERREAAP